MVHRSDNFESNMALLNFETKNLSFYRQFVVSAQGFRAGQILISGTFDYSCPIQVVYT